MFARCALFLKNNALQRWGMRISSFFQKYMHVQKQVHFCGHAAHAAIVESKNKLPHAATNSAQKFLAWK